MPSITKATSITASVTNTLTNFSWESNPYKTGGCAWHSNFHNPVNYKLVSIDLCVRVGRYLKCCTTDHCNDTTLRLLPILLYFSKW